MKENLLLLNDLLEPQRIIFLKNNSIDKLDHIVYKCNNAYHTTIKMKPVDVKSNIRINTIGEIYDKDPNFKIGDIIRISKYKNIFKKKKLLEHFTKKEFQKTNQKEFRVEKVKIEKVINCMLNGNASIVLLTLGLDIDKFKNVPTNLNSSLKSKVDKLDVDKLVPVPVDLSKLSGAVKNEVVYNAKIKDIKDKNKTHYITNLGTITTLTADENKIPNVSNLSKKLTVTQKLVKLKIKLVLTMIIINILLKNLIS